MCVENAGENVDQLPQFVIPNPVCTPHDGKRTTPEAHTELQCQKAVTAYYTSKQLLPIVFAEATVCHCRPSPHSS